MTSKPLERKVALTILALLPISGCMTATPYQPYRSEAAGGVHGGFSEQQLQADHYIVRFHGNELASRDRVEGYLLYRAAELAVKNGFDWFAIVDRRTEHEVRTYVLPDPFYSPWYGTDYPYWRPYWRYYRPGVGWHSWDPWFGDPFWADRMDLRTVESFEAEAEIRLYRYPVRGDDPRAFDARQVMARLGPTIELPRRQ